MSSRLMGIVPAAGSGVRARPYTYEQHKGMFLIDGQPNLERVVAIMRDELEIDEIVMILGYMADSIREHFGDGSEHGVRIDYVENHHLDRGWAWSVLLAKPFLAGRHGCVMLSDEFYLDADFGELTNFPYDRYSAVCLVQEVEDRERIKQNFSVERDGKRVVRLVENPVSTPNNLLGMATFIVASDVIERLEDAYDSGRPSIEFVDFIDELIRDGYEVVTFDISGEYVNLNDIASLEYAQDLAIRRRLAEGST